MANVFSRKLPLEFIDHINNQCGWWKKAMELVDCGELHVAMRDGYLNFYRYGQSIAKITWDLRAKKPVATLHAKYLGEDRSSYSSLEPNDLFLHKLGSVFANVDENHVGPEKRGCHQIAARHAECVIDMEMGLPGLPSRFDMVAALPSKTGSRLTFFEAKHSENPCLRARNECPAVLEQLEKYVGDLSELGAQICLGYASAVDTAKLIDIRSGSLQALAALTPENMHVDDQPRLVVFKQKPDGRELEAGWQDILRKKSVRLIYAEDAQGIDLRE